MKGAYCREQFRGEDRLQEVHDSDQDPDVQADPLDAQIPSISSMISKDSPSINWKLKLTLFGSRLHCLHLICSMEFCLNSLDQIITNF